MTHYLLRQNCLRHLDQPNRSNRATESLFFSKYRKGRAMSSFLFTGEYYYKSFQVMKNKTGEFLKNVEIMRDHMPSMIQKLLHLVQDRTSFNILSVGSGTGDIDLEIVKIVKGELQRSQACRQMKIFNRAIEINKTSILATSTRLLSKTSMINKLTSIFGIRALKSMQKNSPWNSQSSISFTSYTVSTT